MADDMVFVVNAFHRNEAQQVEAFACALRNPVERAILVVSDRLQACLKAIGRLVPDMGWTPSGR